ncbi:hypothetical protein SAZ11_55910 [Streptomyces sp. FXJ1.4098]|nr:hypothetical protein [Streptomyces sp. FXJ1.4098]
MTHVAESGSGSRSGTDTPSIPSPVPPTTLPTIPPTTPPVTAPVLDQSTREIDKATFVPLDVETPPIGQALTKAAFVRQLQLQPDEANAIRDRHPELAEPLGDLLTPSPFSPAPLSAFAAVPTLALEEFGQAVVALRHERAEETEESARGAALQALQTAVVAAKGLEANTAAPRMGLMNLERLEMTPAGIERGELVATIPLAPQEETAVTYKEWSVQKKEFSSIVTDSLETFSETGVTDNTELSQSTSSQQQHSNQFNITGTVSGGIPVISGSVTSGYTGQDAASQSATDSRKHATTLTQKASTRARQEHKVTITTTTVTGTSQTTTRTLKNPSATNPIRIDYFSLMRKWRVRLYRYGMRQTYDVVLPEPAATMRRPYAELEALKAQLGPFVFNVPHNDITAEIRKGDPEPPTTDPPTPKSRTIWCSPTSTTRRSRRRPRTCPADVRGGDRAASAGPRRHQDAAQHPRRVRDREHHHQRPDDKLRRPFGPVHHRGHHAALRSLRGEGLRPGRRAQAGHRRRRLHGRRHRDTGPRPGLRPGVHPVLLLTAEVQPTQAAMERWQFDVWNALYTAAQTKYYAQQQDIAGRIAALEARLNDVDTLTLRREESDEIMKNVLRYLLGGRFPSMPKEVLDAFTAAKVDVAHGTGFEGNTIGPDSTLWTTVRQYEDVVRFVNQAIEWENVVSFLYSYFWDLPESWRFIREIEHPDANRQAFLRAGSARVVLTIRRGWETRWVNFVEHGVIDDPNAPENPSQYWTIAQEIAAYDDRNYPGIPPANPGRSATRLEDAVFTTSTATVGPSTGRCPFRSPPARGSWSAPRSSSTRSTAWNTARRRRRSPGFPTAPISRSPGSTTPTTVPRPRRSRSCSRARRAN